MNPRTHLVLAGIGLIGLVGCNEYGIVEDPDNIGVIDDNLVPDIEVDPASIAFGQVEAGLSVTEVVNVYNNGEGDLHILDIVLDDPEAPYDIGAIGSILVPPGSSTNFSVTFNPETAMNNNAKVLIDSDDPDEPTVEVALIGDGIAPVIEVSPVAYDFGNLYIGCEQAQAVTVSNIGNADLVVNEFNFNTAADLYFDADETTNGALPWTIAPGGSVDVWVDYAPLDEYSDVAYLTVNSNDPATPSFMATQEGTGTLYGLASDLFEQPINGATDILFGLDWSCSMYDDIANVEANFSAFASTLASMDADYHVAVVVEDSGCFLGSDTYIDGNMTEADAQAVFEAMTGTSSNQGVNTERIFSLFESALSSSNRGTGGCNEGFYRDDAKLNLVAISDEPEQSSNDYTYFVSLFQSLKSDSDDLVMHAVAADNPSNGGSNTCGASYDPRYENASTDTGGLYLSICATDWGSHLETLAENSTADLSSFELTDIPVPETIEVQVDGITTVQGWSYNPVDNSVDFETDFVPEGGSTIDVDYALMGDCEQ